MSDQHTTVLHAVAMELMDPINNVEHFDLFATALSELGFLLDPRDRMFAGGNIKCVDLLKRPLNEGEDYTEYSQSPKWVAAWALIRLNLSRILTSEGN